VSKCGSVTGAIGVTNFADLVRRLDMRRSRTSPDPILYVTFNYDDLLEQAVAAVLGTRFDSLRSYIENESLRIVKLHGSVNWWHPLDHVPDRTDDEELRDYLRRPSQVPTLESEFVFDRRSSFLRVTTEGDGSRSRCGYVPALAMPVESKPFVCPQGHVDELQHLLPNVTHVLTIGWRAQEQDFLSMLRSQLPAHVRVDVVTGRARSAEDVLQRLARAPVAHPKGGIRVEREVCLHPLRGPFDAVGGFSEYLRTQRLEELLATPAADQDEHELVRYV
jgi:hypothetical protein